MIPIKILCRCGQKYAFDVKPVNGRMPNVVNCPVCGADGTAAANEIIAASLPSPRPAGLSINRPSASYAAPIAAPAAPPIPEHASGTQKKRRGMLVPMLVGSFIVLLVVGGLLAWRFYGPQEKRMPSPDGSLPHVAENSAKPVANAQQTAPAAAEQQPDYLQGIKEQISLPPKVTAFIISKEQQANDIAQKSGFPLPDDYKDFFADAKAGRARDAKRLFHGFYANSYGTNLTTAQKSPLLQDVLDVSLAYDAFNRANADMVMALGSDLMSSLPANCIYFGGTDAGRGLPTMLCTAPGDPFFVVSQNPLLDSRYRQYLRELYGTHIQIPSTNEFQEIIDTFTTDTQRRWQHDQDFPKEPKQLGPGEAVRIVDGKAKLVGPDSLLELDGLLTKAIFDKNPDREFYIQQSYTLDWMYPYLSPHGSILKLNRQPLPAIPADDLTADSAYWSAKLAQLKSNPKFSGDDYVGKFYAELRSDIAGLYAWRAQSAKDSGERQTMFQAAESAYYQALALYPAAPEAAYGLVNVERAQNKLEAALTVAKNALAANPSNEQLKTLVGQVQMFKQQQAATTTTPAAGTNSNPGPQQQLKDLKDQLDQGKIDQQTYEQKNAQIFNSL